LYGTTAYSVAQRTNEIGIRMALGANRCRVFWAALRDVCFLATLGLALGLVVTLGTSHLVQSFLFGIKTNDTPTLFLAPAILLSAAVLSGVLPAYRATRINPVAALRNE